MASNMALISLPGYLGAIYIELFYRTLFAKKQTWPAIVAGGSNAICALLIQLVSFYLLHWGLIGIALASSVASIFSTIIIIVITFAHNFVHELKLFIPLRNALDDWWNLGVSFTSNIILIFSIRLISELPVIFGGMIGAVELGAASILRRYSAFLFLITISFTTPCINGIGASIGARSLFSLKVYTAATFVFFTCFLSIATILNILLRYPIANLTTNQPAIVEMSASLTILVAVYDLFKMFNACCFFSVFIGSGSIIFPTVTTLVCQFIFSLPLGANLSFYFGLGIAGYYWSMIINCIVEFIFDLTYLCLYLWPLMIAEISTSPHKLHSHQTLIIETTNLSETHKGMTDQEKEMGKLSNLNEMAPIIPRTNIFIRTIKISVIILISLILITVAIFLKIFLGS